MVAVEMAVVFCFRFLPLSVWFGSKREKGCEGGWVGGSREGPVGVAGRAKS